MGTACLSRRFVVALAIGIMMVGLSGLSASTTVRADATAPGVGAPLAQSSLAQSPLATPVQGRSQHLVPTPAPTATFAAYQVSPLRIDGAARPLLAASGSAIWVGAAALLLLGGSVVLVLTGRR